MDKTPSYPLPRPADRDHHGHAGLLPYGPAKSRPHKATSARRHFPSAEGNDRRDPPGKSDWSAIEKDSLTFMTCRACRLPDLAEQLPQ